NFLVAHGPANRAGASAGNANANANTNGGGDSAHAAPVPRRERQVRSERKGRSGPSPTRHGSTEPAGPRSRRRRHSGRGAGTQPAGNAPAGTSPR
ncbi:MAG: hypothetical protein ACR2NR_08520, partial [Solirubrobacteraceae bacterium]